MSLTARTLKPLRDRVLVEKIVAPTRTAAGILLPETIKKYMGTMNIESSATTELVEFRSVKQGDKVLLPEFGGTQIVLGDKE